MKLSRVSFVFVLCFACSAVSPVRVAIGEEPARSWAAAAPRTRIVEDWMFQDHGLDVSACFTSKDDAGVEAAMLRRVLDEINEAAAPFRRRMDSLLESETPGSHPDWKSLYVEACQTRRKKRLARLVERYPRVVFTKHYNLGGSHYAYTENPTDAQFPERGRSNPDYRMGASLCLMEIGAEGTVRFRTLLDAPDGVIRDPDVSYDGCRVLFSMRRSAGEDDYHIYELEVDRSRTRESLDEAESNVLKPKSTDFGYDTDFRDDSQGLRQITRGLGFADVEPVYLPSGDILFNSTRCMQIVDCWWTDVTNLYTCDLQGRFLRRVTFDQVHTNYPKVLGDGRVVYTRWDYNDRGQIYPQPLFVMNADGTGQTEFYGNNSWFPTTILHARGIPDSQKLVAVASGHHSHQRGKLILIDRSQGTQEASGIQLIAPVRETRAERIDAYGQNGDQFQYPYPIDERHFLVTYDPVGSPNRAYDRPYGVYFMDIDGRRELLAFDESISCNQPVPLAPRRFPPLRPSPVDYARETGSYYIQDVYLGPGLDGVERGTVKRLRVVALEFRAAGIKSNRSRGEAGGALASTPVATNNGSWDVKRVLGTIPVEEDGSVQFEVPARTPVYFQLLDERGYVVQSMRSWSTLQPGERMSCLGCHEDKNAVLPPGASVVTEAMRRGPQPLEPFHGPPRGFSYLREIQPIWDAHCIACHKGGKLEDGSDAPMSLLGTPVVDNRAGRVWCESYVNLTRGGEPNDIVQWLGVQSIPPMLPPYAAGAAKSRLLSLLEAGHYDVKISPRERELIACWIDLLVPYCGDYREANAWDARQKAEYAYYEMKRRRMAEIERENIQALLNTRKGSLPPETWTTFDAGGPKAKKAFIDAQLKKQSGRP